MKKITVNKSDEIAEIVEKIIETPETEIVLSIPRFSHLSESLSNFNLIKREANALDKKIIIESVDDHVVELAEMSGLTAINPFFTKNKRQFFDITVPKAASQKRRSETGFLMEKSSEEPKLSRKKVDWQLPKLPKIGRRFWWFLAGVLVLGAAVFLGVKVLPRARVVIAVQTQDWLYNDSVITDRTAVSDVAKMAIPNQIFTQKKNISQKFPATGKRQVEKKATGKINVYNSYSSDPQPLVVKTRFMTPDGKIFLLTKGITVPGAKIADGKIIPFSIEAEVIADKPGPDYNIGPVKLFTIPGFIKGTPKYQAFYGESTGNMTGGFIGEIAYPTENDIKKAKAGVQDTLETNLKTALLPQIPKEFKLLDGATKYQVLDQKADGEADAGGLFGIFSEAKITAIAFKEDDLKMLLEKRAKRDNGEEFDIRSFSLEYGLTRADFDRGLLSFPVIYKVLLARHIDASVLKKELLGKSETELKSKVFALPGLKTATISLWPFWVKSVPNNPKKVKIIVE